MRHHFFDPVFDRPLTIQTPVGDVALGERAPDWALEDRGTFLTQLVSYRDAREAFARSLTAASAAEREFAFAQTFKTLGHVIHLVQDMASPEHVRNDSHLPVGENESIFEKRVDRVVSGLVSLGYPAPRFADPRDYWVSPRGDGSGLAEFTNRHFVTTDTNFATAEPGARGGAYPSPVLDLSTMQDVDVQSLSPVPLRDHAGRLLEGILTFFGSPVVDAVTGEESFNDRLTTLSFFDRDLARTGDVRLFTINRFNVERAAEFLVPRAVGYSAGLLDYFFRGRLEARFQDDPGDASRALLTLVNRGPDPIGPGRVTMYLDGPDAERHPLPGAAVDLALPVPPGAAAPAVSVDGAFEAAGGAIVYRGQMGQEPEAVVGKVLASATVEQVFRGGADWALRTPDGIYPLGLGLDASDVRWGERDNMLVTRVDRVDGTEFAVYRINRAEGDRSVPLRPDGRVDLQLVGIDRLDDEAIPLGTTIDYRNTTHYSQGLVTMLQEVVSRTHPDGSRTTEEHYSLLSNETIGARDYVTARTLPLALTASTPPDAGYSWQLNDFFLSRDGDVHLVAQVFLDGSPGFRVPTRRHSFEGELVDDAFESTFIDQAPLPIATPIFVVNLSRRRVAAKTCADTVRVAAERTERRNAVELYSVDDSDGQVIAGYVPVRAFVTPKPGDVVLFDLEGATGLSGLTLEGVYRDELADTGMLVHRIAEDRRESVHAVSSTAGVAFRVVQRSFRQDPSPAIVTGLMRSNAADGAYALLHATESLGADGAFARRWQALEWAPAPGTTVRQVMPALIGPRSLLSLRAAHRTATLVSESGRDPVDGTLKVRTHILAEAPPVSFDGDLAPAYRLLQPALAYNVEDQQFHRIGDRLVALGAPRPLALGGPPTGVYHVVGRR